jgi:uncharacterized metal-binding protein YceD (DUF177 family)
MTEMMRPVAIDRIGTTGLDMIVDAEPAELTAIATRLLLPVVERLHCSFRLKRLEDSVIEASATLAAGVTQTCVVTLDEFKQMISEEFTVRFVPEGSETEDYDPDSPDQIPYPAGVIDIGEAAIEQLALALDPYPRRPGLGEPAEEVPETPNKFAALAALRRPQ